MSATTGTPAATTRRASAPRRKMSQRPWAVVAGRVGVIVAVIVIWQIVSTLNSLVPSVPATARALGSGLSDGSLLPPLADTLKATTYGFALAAVVGIPISYLLARVRWLEQLVDPFFSAFFAVPRIILYPVLLAMFGITFEAKMWLGALSAIFPIILNSTAGFKSVSPISQKLSRSLGLSQIKAFRFVYWPTALPYVLLGLRIGYSIALIGTVFAEMYAAAKGIGLILVQRSSFQQYPQLFAIAVVLVVTAAILNYILWKIEHAVDARR